MAQVILKKSSVAARVPVAEDLVYGELAINYTDEKLYFKNSINEIKSFSIDTGSNTWEHYVTNWTTTPAYLTNTPLGKVYSYILAGTQRYRFIPSIYTSNQDSFYSNFDGITLSGFIVSRGT